MVVRQFHVVANKVLGFGRFGGFAYSFLLYRDATYFIVQYHVIRRTNEGFPMFFLPEFS